MPADYPFPGAHRHPIKQFEVLIYLAHGCSRKEIASRLDISPDSVKSRWLNALRHLEITPEEAYDVIGQVTQDIQHMVRGA
jgi:DNA-binding NarL/FixJ family response regulator